MGLRVVTEEQALFPVVLRFPAVLSAGGSVLAAVLAASYRHADLHPGAVSTGHGVRAALAGVPRPAPKPIPMRPGREPAASRLPPGRATGPRWYSSRTVGRPPCARQRSPPARRDECAQPGKSVLAH